MSVTSSSSRTTSVRGFLTLFFCAFSLIVTSATSVSAQGGKRPTPIGAAPGTPTGSYKLSDVDSINLYNGRVNIQIPLVNLAGRGTAGGATSLVVNSPALWQVQTVIQGSYVSVQPAQDQYGQGVLSGQYSVRAIGAGMGGPNPCSGSDAPFWSNTLSRLSVISPDGTEHEMRDLVRHGRWHVNASSCYGARPSRGRVFVTTDGSGMTFISDDEVRDGVHEGSEYPTGIGRGWLLLSDGSRYRIDGTVPGGAGGGNIWPSMLERDRNGNSAVPVEDSLKRRVYGNTTPIPSSQCLTLGPGAGPECYYIAYKGWQGAERRVWISYDTDFPQHFPDLVVLPNGLSYRFYYNQYGDLIRLDLPSGGSLEYDYEEGVGGVQPTIPPGYVNNVVPGFYWDYVYRRVVARRVYREGHVLESYQTFSRPETSDGQHVTNAGYVETKRYDSNDNLQGSEKHYFYGGANNSFLLSLTDPNAHTPWRDGREYRTEIFDEDGNLLRQTDYAWAQRAPVSWWTGNQNEAPANDPRVTEKTTRLENGLTSRATYEYDPAVPYNSLTDTKVYGYDGQLLSHTRTTYLKYQGGVDYTGANLYTDSNPQADSTPYLRSLPLQASTFDGAGKELARTTYEYDNYTLDDGNDPAASRKHAPLVNYSDISGLCTWVNSSSQCLNTNPADASDPSGYRTRGNATSIARWLLDNNGLPVGSPLTSYMQYDVAGNVVKAIDEHANVTRFVYEDRFGTANDEARSHTQPAEWLTSGKGYAYPTQVVNAKGFTAFTQYDYYTGGVINAEDVNGTVSSISYNDVLDRPTQVVVAANVPTLRHRSTFQYEDVLRVVTTYEDQNAEDDRAFHKEVRYDGLGRTKESRVYDDVGSPEQYVLVTTGYDDLGRVVKVSNPYKPALNESPVYTEKEYDTLSRVTKVTAPGSRPATNEYAGNTVTVTDQAGKKRSSSTDALGRLTQLVEDPDGYGYVTDYTYDVLGNLRKVKQSSPQGFQERYFAYDSLSRLVRASNPEQETNSNLPAFADPITGRTHWSTSHTYDVLNSTETVTDPRGVATTTAYDQLRRVKTVSYTNDPVNTPEVTFTYDAPGVPKSTGRLTSVSSSVSVYNYTEYDELGRIKGSSQVTGGQTYTMGYTYDLAGELKTETYPSGRVVTTSYDMGGRVTGLTGQKGTQTTQYLSAVKYWSSGAIKEAQLGNGLVERALFNDRLQPREIALGTSNTDSSVLKLEYAYGLTEVGGALDPTRNNGNVQSQKITVSGLAAPLTQTYTYDALNRLKAAEENGGASWKQTFTYDQYGNRSVDTDNTTADAVGDNPQVSPATNRITPRQGEHYRYDKAGNLDRDRTGRTFTFDAVNHLVAFEGGAAAGTSGTNYFFDGLGQRVKKVDYYASTVYVYDAFGNLVAEYANAGGNAGGTSYVTTDFLGTPRVITGSGPSGPVVKSRHDYLPFGEEIGGAQVALKGGRGSGQMYAVNGLNKQFTGQERDAESGLDYFLARTYASGQGRFTSVDPLMASARMGNPQSWNRYAYVINNPLRLVDPTGMSYFVGGSGANDPFIKEYRIDGFEQSPDGTASNMSTEEMGGLYQQWDDWHRGTPGAGTVDSEGNSAYVSGTTVTFTNSEGATFQCSRNAITVIVWGAAEGSNNPFRKFGHIAYLVDGVAYSWQAEMGVKWTIKEGDVYTDERSKDSAGVGYMLDFGYELNKKFLAGVLTAPYKFTSITGNNYYGPFNNCADTFWGGVNAIRNDIKIPGSNGRPYGQALTLPKDVENFINNKLGTHISRKTNYPKH